jgi:hypothetical protein
LIFFADVWDAQKICEHSKTFLFYGAARAQQWQRPSVHGLPSALHVLDHCIALPCGASAKRPAQMMVPGDRNKKALKA